MARNTVWMADRQSVPRSQIQAQPQSVRPTPSLTPQTSYTSNAGQFNRQPSYTGAAQSYQTSTSNVPQPVPQYSYNQAAQPTPIVAAHPGTYGSANTPVNYNRPAPTAVQPTHYNTHQMNGIMSRGTEAYVLSDPANASIPKEIRDQFPTDDQGRLLFFSQPPLDIQHIVSGSTQEEKARPLEHSEKYMKALTVRKRKLEESHTGNANVDGESKSSPQPKQDKSDESNTQNEGTLSKDIPPQEIKERATNLLSEKMKQTTSKEYQTQYGDEWRKVLLADLDYQALCHKKEVHQEQSATKRRKLFNHLHLGKLNGQYSHNTQGYVTDWRKDFSTGSYLDDYDSRLP